MCDMSTSLIRIFVSLDGDEALSDYYRGKGTYRRVANNLKKIRENGFTGEIVARMTVGEETEIDKQVLALAENPGLPISSVHWQLDALSGRTTFRSDISPIGRRTATTLG